jgi:fructose-bisphosphate aldolase class II
MSLVSIGPELDRARKGRYALPLFDTVDMHSTEGMFLALEDKQAPAMIALYSGLLEHPNARAFATYVRIRAEEATVPVSLMLDHGSTFEQCIQAISYGFTDVMYDGSRLPLEQNISDTRAVVRAAHAVGVCVEAELGHVGSGTEYQGFGAQRKGFTDPDAVEQFVEETGGAAAGYRLAARDPPTRGYPPRSARRFRPVRRPVPVRHRRGHLQDQRRHRSFRDDDPTLGRGSRRRGRQLFCFGRNSGRVVPRPLRLLSGSLWRQRKSVSRSAIGACRS